MNTPSGVSQPPEKSGSAAPPSALARLLKTVAAVEALEVKAVLLSMLYFLFLFGSYSVIKPVRDAMGTVYGVKHLQELFTVTLIASLVFSPLYAGLASRMKLSTFLPWVYGFVAATILVFYAMFVSGRYQDRWIAAAFYVWVSTFNLLIISVFWTFMADIFSRAQAKRLFGFIAAGGTIGGIVGPAIATFLAKGVGNNGLMLIAAGGFVVTAVLVSLLAKEKEKLLAHGGEVQKTTLNHRLGGNPLDGFVLLFRSPYLLLLALFLLLMTWISTIVYFQLGDLITKAFDSKEARTQAYATIDLVVNSLAVLVQLFGTGRIIQRFGVQTGLLVNPIIMVIAFLAVAFSPVLMILGGIQIVRRVAEYAVAKPTREMLFTVVDQESKYKAKNVIDTVVYRFGDFSSAWVSAAVLPYGVTGLAIFGVITSVVWFPVAYVLGKRYESVRSGDLVGGKTSAAASGHG
ncbi:MAG TPA: MFS transporter [Steroidobacteraceae bacterium]|jgi:AAA family ATP:ADP antiporter|nr:MFS transporter [Steroidobacteraceae bacterium]